MPRQNIYVSEGTRERLEALAGAYGGMSAAIEEAVARLHQAHFPEQSPGPPHIIGWDVFIAAQDALCSDTGIAIPRGTQAYREVWSDGRIGDILSRESLVADGVIVE